MNAVPKRWLHENEPRTIRPPDGGIWIECEVTHPPSAIGRSVDVFIAADLVTPMLLALRDVARDARRMKSES